MQEKNEKEENKSADTDLKNQPAEEISQKKPVKRNTAKKTTTSAKQKTEKASSEESEKPKRTRKPKPKIENTEEISEKTSDVKNQAEAILKKAEENTPNDNDNNAPAESLAENDATDTEADMKNPIMQPLEISEEAAVSEEESLPEIAEEKSTDTEISENVEEQVSLHTEEPAEEDKFIIPETPTFSLTDPEGVEIELFPTEKEVTETENGLLDIEHFSDYKSRNAESSENSDFESDIENTADYSVSYENITILEDEENTEEEITLPKQKYEDPDRERYNPEKPRKVDGRFDFLELFIFTLLAVILLTTFIFRHSVVEGSSMENTLHEGDHLIISDLFYSPKKGDIVVCQDMKASEILNNNGSPIVKRVIATEGDTIEIRNGEVLVNDAPLTEEYVFIDYDFYVYKDLPKTTVPDDMIFVMGDHRNASSDSRDFSFVREDSVLGKVVLRFYPFDKFGKVS